MLVLNILICDDDPAASTLLRDSITAYSVDRGMECRILTFESSQDLLSAFDQNPKVRAADLIFMDIHMPGLNGLEAAEILRSRGCRAGLIFLTACRKSVFSCFRLKTFRYLLKPLDQAALEEALDAFCKGIEESRDSLHLHFGDRAFAVPFAEILYIEVMRGKIWIHTDNGSFRWSGTLDSLEKRLPCPPFFRIHRSFLVNLGRITGYTSSWVDFPGGKRAMMSRYRFHDFLKAYRAPECLRFGG